MNDVDSVARFRLGGAGEPGPARMAYRPWGTRTLKVEVSSDAELPVLRLRPRTILPEEQDAGIIRGYAEDSRALVVSWGGGHEPGPCLRAGDFLKVFERCAPLAPGRTSTLFFNLTHVGPEVPASATLTLDAFDEASGRVHASLRVHLAAPSGLPAAPIRLTPDASGRWAPTGSAWLPRYDGRWWPDPEVTYAAAAPPPVAIERAGETLRVLWAGADVPVATIVDHTQPTVLDQAGAVAFELFDFAHGLLALRAWFFWLDTRVGPGFFVGRHEVPDVERFDLVIRPADGRVLFACCDAHWREVWGEVPEPPAPPIELTLGLGFGARLELLQSALGLGGGLGRPGAAPGSYNPRAFIETAVAGRAAPPDAQAGPTRDKGTEAHLPSLQNVQQPAPDLMISSDARLG